MVTPLHTILVATDFSDASTTAVLYACELARACQARLYVLHVVPEGDVQILKTISEHLESYVNTTTLVDALYADADKRLAAILSQAQASDLVQERLIVTGKAVPTILHWAAAKQAQLIIVGTHGRGGMDRLLLGSVASGVVRQAPCSVLVVPIPKPD